MVDFSIRHCWILLKLGMLAFFLMMCIVRLSSRRPGEDLVNLGRSGVAKFSLIGGFLIAAWMVAGLVIDSPSGLWSWLDDISNLWFAACSISQGIGTTALCAGGVRTAQQFFPWRDIDSYRWVAGSSSPSEKTWLRLHHREGTRTIGQETTLDVKVVDSDLKQQVDIIMGARLAH